VIVPVLIVRMPPQVNEGSSEFPVSASLAEVSKQNAVR
jgi:hypothetical protein